MNVSQILDDWIKGPMTNYFEEEKSQGAFLALVEMTLAIIGTILNLIVLIPIISSSLKNSTLNILIANLCLANLVSAVFVKLIGVIYHGYAVAAASWEIDITFCTIYTLTSRAMWAVFPYTIISICSLGLVERASKIFVARKISMEEEEDATISAQLEQQSSKLIAQDSKDSGKGKDNFEDLDDDTMEGFTALQKTFLVFIWMSSLVYSMISNVILTKERDVKCSMRSDLDITFNLVSIIVVIAVPIFCICLWFVAHIALSLCMCVKKIVFSNTTEPSIRRNPRYLSKRKNSSSLWVEIVIIFCFVIVFLTVYPSSMYITETYFAHTKTIFPFMLIKYCVGSLQLIISPLCVLLIKRDIRRAVKRSYTQGSTQNDETEITFEELQEHLGIGVNVNN